MFPPKTSSDAPADVPMAPMHDSSVVCPACGEKLHLAKAPSAPKAPKLAGSTESKGYNAAKMPMDQLKNVIKSGSAV